MIIISLRIVQHVFYFKNHCMCFLSGTEFFNNPKVYVTLLHLVNDKTEVKHIDKLPVITLK